MAFFSILFISGNKDEIAKMSEMVHSACPSLEIKKAASGKEAFFLLKECRKENRPAAIIIDYMLPDIKGLEFFRIIIESEKYRDIPILIMSGTYIEPGDRADVLFAGAAGFIQKPDFSKSVSKENMCPWGESFCRELAYQLKLPYGKLCTEHAGDKEE
ncbi:MAG: response regulator [Elusimicrobiales bacterium]|nr:response regulator [Elusimicrobiales bacterium]